jgi:hypothetical protein
MLRETPHPYPYRPEPARSRLPLAQSACKVDVIHGHHFHFGRRPDRHKSLHSASMYWRNALGGVGQGGTGLDRSKRPRTKAAVQRKDAIDNYLSPSIAAVGPSRRAHLVFVSVALPTYKSTYLHRERDPGQPWDLLCGCCFSRLGLVLNCIARLKRSVS